MRIGALTVPLLLLWCAIRAVLLVFALVDLFRSGRRVAGGDKFVWASWSCCSA